MKVNKELSDIRTAVRLTRLYIEQKRVGEFEGTFILNQLVKVKERMIHDIIHQYELVQEQVMEQLEAETYHELDREDGFHLTRDACEDLRVYDEKLYDEWEDEKMRDL